MRLSEADWEYLDERARGFTGRGWVINEVRSFLAGPGRILLISGPPGVGKTAIAARLAALSAGRAPARRGEPAIPPEALDAAVICRNGRVDLLDVAQRLSGQLAEAIPAFRREQRRAVAAEIHVEGVHVQTGAVAEGADVAGVKVVLDRLGAERAFSTGVAVPLLRLSESEDSRQAVILIDALDEAMATPVARGLPRLVADLVGVKLVVTARDDRRLVAQLGTDLASLHLLKDAPASGDDVLVYVTRRLDTGGSSSVTSLLARRIANEARGNFLYAAYVCDALAGSETLATLDEASVNAVPLPPGGLPGVYREFLRRELAQDEATWSERYRPILGPIAVALGDGLTTRQLAEAGSVLAGKEISVSGASDVIRIVSQFLDGEVPDGPFRPYHRSFAEFLVSAEQNPDWPVDEVEAHHAVVSALVEGAPQSPVGDRPAWEAADAYARQYLTTHAALAGVLDRFLLDADYLLAAHPAALGGAVLGMARTLEGRRVATAWRRFAHRLADPGEPSRAGYLRLAALEAGADGLLASIDAEHGPAPNASAWTPLWAWWRHATPTRTLGELPSSAEGVAIVETDDGTVVVAGGAFGLEVWSADSAFRLAASTVGAVSAVTVGRAETRPAVVAGFSDGGVATYTLPDLREVAVVREAHDQVLTAMAIGDERTAATGGAEGDIVLWDVATLDRIATKTHAHTMVRALAAAALGDALVLVSAGDTLAADGRRETDLPAVRVWAIPSLDPVCRLATDQGIVTDVGAVAVGDSCVVFVPEIGGVVGLDVIESDGHVERLTSLQPLFMSGQCLILEAGEDAEVLADEGGVLHSIRIMAGASGARAKLGAPIEAESGRWAGPAAVEGRRSLVSASAKLRLWDVEELQASATPGDLSQTQRAHGVEALAVAGEVLAAVTSSGDVRRWLWRSGQELAPLQVDDLDVAGIRGVTIENENAVVVAHQSGLVETFDAETGQRDPVSLSAGEKLLCFAVVPLEGRPVAATAVQLGIEQDIGGPRAFHGVRLWDLATGVEIDTRHARADLRSSRESLAWKLVPPRSDRRIDVIEASTGPADAVIAVGSARAVTTWSMSDLGREGSVSRSYTTSALALRGSRLAIADSRGTIEVWDVHRLAGASIGERIAEHPGVTSLLLARWRGMAALLSGGTDRCLRVWSPDGGTIEVIEIDEPVTSLAELPDGHLAVGTRRGLMVLSIG